MDVNIDTKSRIIRKQVFREQEPRNYKTTTLGKKGKAKEMMVDAM
jgi:hypothetical protein